MLRKRQPETDVAELLRPSKRRKRHHVSHRAPQPRVTFPSAMMLILQKICRALHFIRSIAKKSEYSVSELISKVERFVHVRPDTECLQHLASVGLIRLRQPSVELTFPSSLSDALEMLSRPRPCRPSTAPDDDDDDVSMDLREDESSTLRDPPPSAVPVPVPSAAPTPTRPRPRLPRRTLSYLLKMEGLFRYTWKTTRTASLLRVLKACQSTLDRNSRHACLKEILEVVRVAHGFSLCFLSGGSMALRCVEKVGLVVDDEFSVNNLLNFPAMLVEVQCQGRNLRMPLSDLAIHVNFKTLLRDFGRFDI